jgi:hypothetical protein
MQDKVAEMLCEEIGRIRARMEEAQQSLKRHPKNEKEISAAKIELVAFHTRLDDLHEREKKYFEIGDDS